MRRSEAGHCVSSSAAKNAGKSRIQRMNASARDCRRLPMRPPTCPPATGVVPKSSGCGWMSTWPSQDHHTGRGPPHERHGRAMMLDGPINGDWFEPMLRKFSCRNCGLVTSSSWTISRAKSDLPSVIGARRQGQRCASCHLIVPTSTQSRKPSPPQGHAPKSRRALHQRPVGPHRQARRHLPAHRMCQLL